jgi:peptidoglycan/LPS O-acetylase OafA/YrhL
VSFLGVLSYPLYLVHHVLLGALGGAPFALRAPLAFALSVGVAFAIHELVEKPCARLRKRLTAPDGPRLAEIPAPALASVRSP